MKFDISDNTFRIDVFHGIEVPVSVNSKCSCNVNDGMVKSRVSFVANKNKKFFLLVNVEQMLLIIYSVTIIFVTFTKLILNIFENVVRVLDT